jgi:transposase
MKSALAFVLLAFSAFAFAQAPQIKRDATVYIEPTGGYENELAAALMKEKVPLVVAADKDKADYILRGNLRQAAEGNWSAESACITVIDARASQIVFAYSASTNRGKINGLAENCA